MLNGLVQCNPGHPRIRRNSDYYPFLTQGRLMSHYGRGTN